MNNKKHIQSPPLAPFVPLTQPGDGASLHHLIVDLDQYSIQWIERLINLTETSFAVFLTVALWFPARLHWQSLAARVWDYDPKRYEHQATRYTQEEAMQGRIKAQKKILNNQVLVAIDGLQLARDQGMLRLITPGEPRFTWSQGGEIFRRKTPQWVTRNNLKVLFEQFRRVGEPVPGFGHRASQCAPPWDDDDPTTDLRAA